MARPLLIDGMVMIAYALMLLGGNPDSNGALPLRQDALEEDYARREREAAPLEEFRGGTASPDFEAVAVIGVMLGALVVGLVVFGIAAIIKAAS